MIPFLIVLTCSVVGFAITYRALDDDKTEDMRAALEINFQLMFGAFAPVNFTWAGWILFVISACMLPLVMLNLLIAVMTDIYNKVMDDIVPSDFYELNNLILEQEELMGCKKKSGSEMYMHFV